MEDQVKTPIRAELRMMEVGSKRSYPIEKMETIKVYTSNLKKKKMGEYTTKTTDSEIIVTRLK